VTPKEWFANGLTPLSKVHCKFLVYRADTPELALEKIQADNEVTKTDLMRYSKKGQTVYELATSVIAPDWWQTIDGEITCAVNYTSEKRLFKIPYEIKSKNLIECNYLVVYFGLVVKDEKVTRDIILRPSKKQNAIRLKILSLPNNIEFEINDPGQKTDEIIAKMSFSSQKLGIHKDTVKLLAFDKKDNKQTIELQYCAIVHE
jgi:hypothetical protein